MKSSLLTVCLILIFLHLPSVHAHPTYELSDLVKDTSPSVVGIGLLTPIQSRAANVLGTGFVVGDGDLVVTNYHVVSKELDPSIVQYYVAFVGEGAAPSVVKLELLEFDPVHDLAILRLNKTLPALELASDEMLPSGSEVAFIGFPIGAVLGMYPATHIGIISAIAPDINPARNADELTVKMLSRLKHPFFIYQLDATAYPGNSGSPVLSRKDGKVIGVINKVFVSEGKEAALSKPSGISYAVPIKQLRKLAKRANIVL